MNDEQITALARECAEWMIKDAQCEELPNCLKKTILASNTEYAEGVFRWLLRRFCLVEKDRVKDEYEKAKMDLASKYHQGSMVVLQVLFPELAKAERALDTTITKKWEITEMTRKSPSEVLKRLF